VSGTDGEDNKTVVVVDDDEAARDSLAALLETAGFSVETFPSAQAFLGGYDPASTGCLLLDVRMPGLSGTQLHQELGRRGIMLPVIIVTGFGDIPMAVAAIKAGALDFIEKPYSDAVILDRVRLALAHASQGRAQTQQASRLRERIELLTPREREVFACLIAGDSNKQAGSRLGISPRTVEIHRARIMEKMRAANLSQLVRMAISAGFEPDGP
jgi:two-component system response regulator FixJ